MKALTSIVALNSEGAIGAHNRLPWRVRSDLRFFREQTLNQVVIMGRKTFDSLNQRGLPDRKNIVLTHGFGMMAMPKNCRAAHSIEEALLAAEDWSAQRQSVFVVGGASMYEQFAPFIDRYLVTLVHKPVPDADTHFSEDLGDRSEWTIRELRAGKADGINDEADFEIFEFLRVGNAATQRRHAATFNARQRRAGNSLVDESWSLRAVG